MKFTLAMTGLACVLLLGAARVARAEAAGQEQTRDLGEALSYFRVTDPGRQLAEIRGALAAHPAIVLDLRGAGAGNAAARAFRAALVSARPGNRVARFVLVNGATAPAIVRALGGGVGTRGVPGVLVIAPGAAGVPADVPAPGSVDDDRRACEAIARGAPLYTLINHQPDKPRDDEAELVREQNGEEQPEQQGAGAAGGATGGAAGGAAGGATGGAAGGATGGAAGGAASDGFARGSVAGAAAVSGSATAAGSGCASAGASPPVAAAPLTDLVLQLAVQIHRSLLALGRL